MVLRNMKLRGDLFASLPLPFALDFGQIGLIRIKVPVMKLFTSSPVVIEISDVLAVIRPKHIKEWSEEVELKEYKERNRRMIEKHEIYEENIQKLI